MKLTWEETPIADINHVWHTATHGEYTLILLERPWPYRGQYWAVHHSSQRDPLISKTTDTVKGGKAEAEKALEAILNDLEVPA